MKKEILETTVMTVLKKYGDAQANLGSEGCRHLITQEIVTTLTKKLPVLEDIKL